MVFLLFFTFIGKIAIIKPFYCVQNYSCSGWDSVRLHPAGMYGVAYIRPRFYPVRNFPRAAYLLYRNISVAVNKGIK